jgi:PASTA domain
MSQTTTAHARTTGRLTVGDYVGHAAGEAAQAVRRAGLRPGLDRSVGHDPALTGHIVDQEPEPGSTLARNGLVTLFVAAPGPVPNFDDDSVRKSVAQPTRSVPSGSRPRRATGRASVGSPAAGDASSAESEPPFTNNADLREGGEWDASGEAVTERLDDGLVARANDLFAARAAAGGRARWPDRARARVLGMRAHIRGRSLLLRAATAALAIWFVVGIAAALSGHRAATHPAAPEQSGGGPFSP